MLHLNFDMIGSPNYGRSVYDGDASAFDPGDMDVPAGSGVIEAAFHEHFGSVVMGHATSTHDVNGVGEPYRHKGKGAAGHPQGKERGHGPHSEHRATMRTAVVPPPRSWDSVHIAPPARWSRPRGRAPDRPLPREDPMRHGTHDHPTAAARALAAASAADPGVRPAAPERLR
ncbi:MAG: hypothetical protein ACOC84_11995 [Actinomycetota bacterium]